MKMLRNGFRTSVYGCTVIRQPRRKLSISMIFSNKSSFNMNRQGKIMSKLFGQKISGSKKRWYPTTEASAQNKDSGSLFLKASQLSKPGGAGKNTSRRSTVLNKLFMEEISSLLATGSIAECFLGRGLQLTRVKISPDFACVNVYWLANGDPQTDEKLDEDLKRYSGLIRHELSQLRVMGEVPRIHFLQDKTFANIEHVEALLKNMEFENDDTTESESLSHIDFKNYTANRIKHEFYGNSKTEQTYKISDISDSLPPMRHDVFGLDHRNITSKILTKMRKTKEAWIVASSERQPSNEKTGEESPMLNSVQQKIMENNETSSIEFNKFLAQRSNRKNTPERKKYRRSDDISLLHNNEDIEGDAIISKQLKNYIHEDDYLHEDHIDDKKS